MICEKCLYRKNCQFLGTHKKVVVEVCEVFLSEKEIKAETYKEFAEWLYSLFPTENSEIVVISRTGIAKKVNELLGKRSD